MKPNRLPSHLEVEELLSYRLLELIGLLALRLYDLRRSREHGACGDKKRESKDERGREPENFVVCCIQISEGRHELERERRREKAENVQPRMNRIQAREDSKVSCASPRSCSSPCVLLVSRCPKHQRCSTSAAIISYSV